MVAGPEEVEEDEAGIAEVRVEVAVWGEAGEEQVAAPGAVVYFTEGENLASREQLRV